jgi:uncharacterized protein
MLKLMRPLFFSLTAAIALAVLIPVESFAQADPLKNKVVIQIADQDVQKWNQALGSARNIQNTLGRDTVDLEIIVHNQGITMLKGDSVVANRVADTLASGIKVVACEGTMKFVNLSRADMLPNIGYVPSGNIELIRKQQQGYAYIRP